MHVHPLRRFRSLMKTCSKATLAAMVLALNVGWGVPVPTPGPTTDGKAVGDEHAVIGVGDGKNGGSPHTMHPDAQWFPDAGFGLFLHWGISSVHEMNISWPMIPGRPLAEIRVSDPVERERIVREKDYDLTGKAPGITPNGYWSMAKDFNPRQYDPDKWLKAAKAAGFTYVVLTARHHEGFALWPSAYGDFNTKNFMGGRDLLAPFVDACRRNGLKVGLYYSPPDWHFDRDYMDFLYYRVRKTNPEFKPLDADLNVRATHRGARETAEHQAAYEAMVKGQVEELLTRYGKIDLLWFDGRPPTKNGRQCITAARIRELQPGIVINPRLHGKGDFVTYERELTTNKVATQWAEFCNTWTALWTYSRSAFRSNGFVIGQLAKCRSLGINYLLGIGPDGQGELHPAAYQNMEAVAGWMRQNGSSIHGTKPLKATESASVPATAAGDLRYLFAIPSFDGKGLLDENMLPIKDVTLTLGGVGKPVRIRLLGDGGELKFDYRDQQLSVFLPAARRTRLVDVVEVRLDPNPK